MQVVMIVLAAIGTLWLVCAAFLGAIAALFAFEEHKRRRAQKPIVSEPLLNRRMIEDVESILREQGW